MFLGPKKMEVECSVENCIHWDSNYCTAKKLAVHHSGDGYAETSEGTCCKTFIHLTHAPTRHPFQPT